MTGWEIKDFFWKVQKEAQAGNSEEIDRFTSQYPLSCVSANYSLFVILRQFHVQLWGDERRILNCEPGTHGGQPSDGQQWGITISRCNIEDGGLKISLCIPNYSYTGITCNSMGEITISSEQQAVATNEIELKRKLKFIAGNIPNKRFWMRSIPFATNSMIFPHPKLFIQPLKARRQEQ